MDKITRDIYFLRDTVKYPIDYPQGADTIPIIFTSRDYNLPSGSTVRVCVKKPSGRTIYNEINTVSGNVITINPEKQMVAESGRAELQVEIKQGEKELLSFIYPIHVKRSLINIDSENGSNFIDEYLKKIQAGIDAMEETREEIIEMAESGAFSASVDIGDTATLESDQEATVKNVGTTRDAILNFGIPRGKTGEIGPRGPQGIQGPIGPPGKDGADGTATIMEIKTGLFAMNVNEEGHLMMTINEGEEPPDFRIEEGRLLYVFDDGL